MNALLLCLMLAGCLHSPARSERVEEARYVPIGGIEQWVTIRGDDVGNPVLLFVHGGPGDVQSPLVTTYAPYERDFVLVQWDQRGAGRTFARNGRAGPDLSLQRQVADGIELAEWLRQRFAGKPVILMGHSYGTLVAVAMARQRPELFAAYVGTGQVSRWADTVNFQFDFLSRRAREAADDTLLASLQAIGRPDPQNVAQYFGFSRSLRRFMHPSDGAWLAGLRDLVMTQPGFTEEDFAAVVGGMELSGPALVQATFATDLFSTAPALELPVIVIQGRHDVSTPTEPARAWFDRLAAPRKRFIVIEDAGHFALATNQAEFIAELSRALRELSALRPE